MRKAKIINEAMLINFYKKAQSISDTAKEFGINRNRVRSILSRHSVEVFGNKGGAPKKTGEYEKKRLVKGFKARELKLASEGVDYLREAHNIKVSDQTVRNILKESGLVVRNPVKTPFLSLDNLKGRREYYRRYKNYITADFKNFVFSDESRYKLSGSDSNNTYYGEEKENFVKREKMRMKKFGGGSIHVWGCITFFGVGKIIRLEGSVKTDSYIDTLIEGLFGSLELHGMRADETVFQQDNASPHTSKKTLKFLNDQKITTITWPSNSPDMNIIENLWNEVNRAVRKVKNNFSSEDELWKEVEKAWYNIAPRYVKRLYYSLPSRIKALKENNFDTTKY